MHITDNLYIFDLQLTLMKQSIRQQIDLKFNTKCKRLHLCNLYIYRGNRNIDCYVIAYLICKDVSELQSMNISVNPISDVGVNELRKGNWQKLNTVGLYSSSISEEGIKFMTMLSWKNLKYLNLSFNRIGAKGCKYLTRCFWPSLHQLYLQANQIGNEGVIYLSRGTWRQLTQLSISKNQITMNGLVSLKANNWAQIKNLFVYQRQLDVSIGQLLMFKCPKIVNLIILNDKPDRAFELIMKSKYQNLRNLDLTSYQNL